MFWMVLALVVLSCCGLIWLGLAAPQQEKNPPVVNTQNPKDVPPTPLHSLRGKSRSRMASQRHAVCRAEPDVRPAAHLDGAWDDRGRLCCGVAESATAIPDRPATRRWAKDRYSDRVLIFEDTDNDGRFDKQYTVFADKVAEPVRRDDRLRRRLGAVCAESAVHPRPQRRVGAWSPDQVGAWSPDCWHGLQGDQVGAWSPDQVGAWSPDHAPSRQTRNRAGRFRRRRCRPQHRQRIDLGAGRLALWPARHSGYLARGHARNAAEPARQTQLQHLALSSDEKDFRGAVTHGTTNPWGFDYDDHGQMFFTNNVNGHLWHIIPGAHFKRMYGEDFDPHLYELIDEHSDHKHYDASKSWNNSGDNKGKNAELGGGHSHVGGMIYLGDNFPDKYRNTIFMCNTHGHRVNNDFLTRHGSGYAGTHGKDFLFANDPWFRGIDIRSGPDGGVYICDWSDIGECHDNDGIHRSSGRIYKVTYGKARRRRSRTRWPSSAAAELVKPAIAQERLVRARGAAGDFAARAVPRRGRT